MNEDNLFYGVAWYMVLLFSTTLHEASHAFTALKMGDDTAHRGGQVSLDPTPHIQREPFGMVLVPILSFILSGCGWMIGWASAPYDPQWAQRYPRRAALMAMAGPASNFVLCLLAAILIKVGILAGCLAAPISLDVTHVVSSVNPGLWHLAAVLLSVTFSLNLLLFTFNLIPLPPMDGSSIPLLFLSDEAAEKYTNFVRAPGMSFVGIFLAWNLFGAIFPHIHHFATDLLYPGAYRF